MVLRYGITEPDGELTIASHQEVTQDGSTWYNL